MYEKTLNQNQTQSGTIPEKNKNRLKAISWQS